MSKQLGEGTSVRPCLAVAIQLHGGRLGGSRGDDVGVGGGGGGARHVADEGAHHGARRGAQPGGAAARHLRLPRCWFRHKGKDIGRLAWLPVEADISVQVRATRRAGDSHTQPASRGSMSTLARCRWQRADI